MAVRPIATTRMVTGIPTGRLAVWWVVASEIVIFGGLLVSYIMNRLAHPEWANHAIHTNTWAGAFNTFVLLSSSLSAVLGHYAENDGWASPASARELESSLKSQGKEAEFHIYPDTEHAFFNDTRPDVYKAEAAKISWERTLAFFRQHLG